MSFVEAEFGDAGRGVVVCRTGYTGERGYELIAANDIAGDALGRADGAGEPYGILACGLGARDTLRTEMGYPLHGQDITLDVTPNEAGLGWAVGWKKDAFWGKDVLVAEKEAGPKRTAARARGGRPRHPASRHGRHPGPGRAAVRHHLRARSRRRCARASGSRWSRRSSTPMPSSASTCAGAGRSSSRRSRPSSTPSVRES